MVGSVVYPVGPILCLFLLVFAFFLFCVFVFLFVDVLVVLLFIFHQVTARALARPSAFQ